MGNRLMPKIAGVMAATTGEQRRPDGRRPKHVPTEGELVTPRHGDESVSEGMVPVRLNGFIQPAATFDPEGAVW
jgi:hypothetical protein